MLQQDIIDNISSGIIGLDAEYRVRLINPAAESILRLSEARILGQVICDLPSPDVPWRETLIQADREERSIVRRGLPVQTRDGHSTLTDVIISPMREAPELAFLIELQPVDLLLRISNEENLLNTQETTRAMVRGLAHEIKNPLGGIRGAAQLLERELPTGTLQEYTNIIILEADRLRSLVDRLLGPNKKPALATLNIHKVLEHVLQLIIVEAGERLAVQRDYDPSLPEVMADQSQLIQAVLNILRNALEATESQPQCAITLRTRSQRQFTIGEIRHRLVCRMDIIDNGPGIPKELRETLYAPMVSSRPDGTGLGLSIAQSIVHRHGGLLRYKSWPGETCFSIYLPMEQ
ncbi:MAG: two-component system nitrogen regulation sensor histidine kinase GlnL [Halieaceae bacterium]|jgi:two-component system nitrogen regulation sensor histidine kinase GlnL